MFDSKYLSSGRQPMVRQLDKLCGEEIRGGANFLTWFREHVNPYLTSDLSMICIMFNHLTYLIGSQCVLADNIHATYDNCYTEALLPKVTVDTTSTGFASVQLFLKLLTHWRPQLIQELLQGLLMQKDMNLSTTGSLNT
jgi:hypothetical protein